MTHKERVLAAISHRLPDRVPLYVSAIEYPDRFIDRFGLRDIEDLYKYFDLDLRCVLPEYTGCDPRKNVYNIFGLPEGAAYSSNLIQLPFADSEDITDIEKFNWPDISEWDFESLCGRLDELSDEYAVMAGSWSPIFCQILWFFGVEPALMNLYLKPKLIQAVLEHIETFYIAYYKKLFGSVAGKAVFFNMGDDFGTQRGMMIEPGLWRKLFKPVYKKIFSLAKSFGLYVWFHSCGAISDVIPDLIEIGMDVWETVQTHLPGNEPERIKKEYGKDITFFGAINTQSTLPYGTVEQVRNEVRERIKVLGKSGGYICGPDHQIKTEMPFENIMVMFDEIKKFRYEGCTSDTY